MSFTIIKKSVKWPQFFVCGENVSCRTKLFQNNFISKISFDSSLGWHSSAFLLEEKHLSDRHLVDIHRLQRDACSPIVLAKWLPVKIHVHQVSNGEIFFGWKTWNRPTQVKWRFTFFIDPEQLKKDELPFPSFSAVYASCQVSNIFTKISCQKY